MSADKIAPLRKPVECPNCGNPSQREPYPFCSKRCSDLDLNRWFSGNYTIETQEYSEDTD